MAVIGRRAKALTTDGAVAASVIGFIVFVRGGVAAALPLLVFFVSGSWLTRWRMRQQRHPNHHFSRHRSERPHPRDVEDTAARHAAKPDANGRRASQVLANGGMAAATMVAAGLWPHPAWMAAYAGAIATSTADTWATELGTLSKRPPVLITTGASVTPGQSGAVSLAGTMAGTAGAIIVGVVTAASSVLATITTTASSLGASLPGLAVGGNFTEWTSAAALRLAIVGALGGVVGMLADSLLGATVQEHFLCSGCGARTESSVHCCGEAVARVQRVGGWPGVNNDVVNFMAALVGSGVAAWLFHWLTPVSG